MAEARNMPPVSKPIPQNHPAPENSQVRVDIAISPIPMSARPMMRPLPSKVIAGEANCPAHDITSLARAG